MITIVADIDVFDRFSPQETPVSDRQSALSAWEVTRRLSSRAYVHVMKRDAYGRLDAHRYPLQHPVGPLPPDAPWTIDLADESGLFRILCFDFDGKAAGVADAALTEAAQDDCDALARILDGLAIAHVVCRSSASGGRHLWIALSEGLPADTAGQLARTAHASLRTLDFGMLLNPRAGAARPPLSPHRDGSSSTVLRGDLSTLISPSTTAADVAALLAQLEARRPALRPVDSAPSGPVDPSHKVHRALSAAGAAHMATVAGGSNPSWTGFMCLLAAAAAGWSFLDVQHAAQSAPGMEHYRTRNDGHGRRRPRSKREAANRIQKQWETATRWAALYRPLAAERPPQDLTDLEAIVSDVEALMAHLQATPGRWGRTEAAAAQRTVLQTLAFLTLHTGKRAVAASIRDLGLTGPHAKESARKALLALQEAGLVQKTTAAAGSNAAEWRLSPHLSTASGTLRSQPLKLSARPPHELFATRAFLIARLERDLLDRTHDVFTRGGIGHMAGRAYALLAQLPSVTVESAARLLGISTRYAATILSRLRRHRLITDHAEGWVRARRDLRDAAARVLGVAGVLIARVESYRIDREVWAWWQAETAHMLTAPHKRQRRRHATARTLDIPGTITRGERDWPVYPRTGGRGDHIEARRWARDGRLEPGSLWWSAVA